MSIANTIETNSTVKTTAVFSKNRKDRYLLKAEWDSNKKSLAIIMTYPSSADELIFDQTTMLVRNGAVKNDFGSVSIINLFSSIDNPFLTNYINICADIFFSIFINILVFPFS